jgi:hypothetical protein
MPWIDDDSIKVTAQEPSLFKRKVLSLNLAADQQ